MRRLVALFGSIVICAAMVHGQSGSIRGQVQDKDFEAPIPGVRVRIVEIEKKAVTIEQGSYLLSDVPAGAYTLVFAKQGYRTAVRANVIVGAGQLVQVDAAMAGDFTQFDDYVVERPIQLGTSSESALLDLRFKETAQIDSIGADLLSRAGASNAADALRFVTGATVNADNQAVIRGLPDRFVSTQINGVVLPSSDAETRSVELDQFPSAAIESVQVTKTFTPDQQGNASGGAVNIVTKTIPDQPVVFQFQTQVGFNSQVRGRSDFLTYNGGGVSLIGEDDGRRSLQTENIGSNWEGAVGARTGQAPIDYKWSAALRVEPRSRGRRPYRGVRFVLLRAGQLLLQQWCVRRCDLYSNGRRGPAAASGRK